LGESDQAFTSLQQAYKEQSNILQFLKAPPSFDPIRCESLRTQGESVEDHLELHRQAAAMPI
jgi:hypothetical protein